MPSIPRSFYYESYEEDENIYSSEEIFTFIIGFLKKENVYLQYWD